MIISHHKQVQDIGNEEMLVNALLQRDERGGEEFWLSHKGNRFPCLAIMVSGEESCATFFPSEGHPGFRCLNENPARSHDENAEFVWVGCDPSTGELIPNQFVLPFSTLFRVAKEFFHSGAIPTTFAWFELC
jgi:hypothetical protein